jgi:hypothetical protein
MRKNRDLSPLELFNALQEEWFLAYLRYRIYADKKQKFYNKKLMTFKEEKINDIAAKNRLDTIFTSSEVKLRVRNKVFGERGFPDIRYKNNADRDALEFTDKANYYMKNEEVRVDEGGKYMVGNIIGFNIVNDIVTVKELGSERVDDFPITQVQRII